MATDPMWCFENYSAAAEEIDELTAERDKLKEALEFCAGTSYIDDAHRVADEALKESA